MRNRSSYMITTLCLALLLALSSTGLQAGTKVKVKGDVESVSEQVNQAFETLEIEQADASRNSDHAMAVGKSRSGTRVTVAVNRAGDEDCEVTVSSDSPSDPEIEERFLRLMQSR